MASKARCKTKGELEDMTVKQLKYFAARKHIELNPSFRKSEIIHEISLQCRRSRASRSYAKPKYTRSRKAAASRKTATCTAMFTQGGRPYSRSCQKKEGLDEDADEEIPLCARHQLPKSREAVMQASGVGRGADFREGKEIAVQMQTVGDDIQIQTIAAQRGRPELVRNKTFVVNTKCITAPYEMGKILAADTQMSVVMQLCKAGDCSRYLLFAELLPTKADEESWKKKIRQYNQLGYKKYQLQLESSWICDSGSVRYFIGTPGSWINAGVVGFSITVIPPGTIFKPLRDFMLDATDPASWKNMALTACNWIRKQVSPYGLMESRYIRSGVPAFLKVLLMDGAIPNTMSPETFGVLVTMGTGFCSPVILPCMDELTILKDRSLADQFVKLNTTIVYNSVTVGVMRDGAPADYQPSLLFRSLIDAIILPSPVMYTLSLMGKIITPTMQIVDRVSKAPLVFGVSISDALGALATSAMSVYNMLVPSIREIIDGLQKYPWVTLCGSAVASITSLSYLSGPQAYVVITAIKIMLSNIQALSSLKGAAEITQGVSALFAGAPMFMNLITMKLIQTGTFREDQIFNQVAYYYFTQNREYFEKQEKWYPTVIAQEQGFRELVDWTIANLKVPTADPKCSSKNPFLLYMECEVAKMIMDYQAGKKIPHAREFLKPLGIWETASGAKSNSVQFYTQASKIPSFDRLDYSIIKEMKGFDFNITLGTEWMRDQAAHAGRGMEHNLANLPNPLSVGAMEVVTKEKIHELRGMTWLEKLKMYFTSVEVMMMQNPGMTLGIAVAFATVIITSKLVYEYRADAKYRSELQAALDEKVKLLNSAN